MEDKIISFETAKLAEEKKFNISGQYKYIKLGEVQFLCEYDSPADCYYCPLLNDHIVNDEESTLASTQSLLQKWLREEHKIHVKVDRDEDYWICSICDFSHGNRHVNIGFLRFETYEQSLEEGLYNALKLIRI